jgi:hypothetical protein
VTLLVAILTLLLLGLVILLVGAPLRAARRARDPTKADAPREPPAERATGELQSAREAKYREIRDAELDYRTGKLSREDFEAIDGELRVEAIEILDRIEAAERDVRERAVGEGEGGG